MRSLRLLTPLAAVPLLALAGAGCHNSSSDGPSGLAASAETSTFDAELARSWLDFLYLEVKTTAGYSPPVAARAYGYAGVALYEAVVAGMPDHQTLAGQLNELLTLPEPTNAVHHWPTVANATLEAIALDFFPLSAVDIEAQADGFYTLYEASEPADVFARSVTFGQDLAAAILAWADADGFSDVGACNTAFVAPVVDGPWVGTGLGLQPCWGTLRTFVVTDGGECAAFGHPLYSELDTSDFYAHALLVANTTGDAGATLTADQADIANYWADGAGTTGTPPGHSICLATTLLALPEFDRLDIAAEAYARVGMAVHDAFVTCWQTKFETYLLRPITYIRAQIDAGWDPLITTPNFPTYSSGHSTQSGAAGTVLTELFGTVTFTDTTHSALNPELLFTDRAFTSIMHAANEAKISRLYGGIHYAFDNQDGFDQGVCIGETINNAVDFLAP